MRVNGADDGKAEKDGERIIDSEDVAVAGAAARRRRARRNTRMVGRARGRDRGRGRRGGQISVRHVMWVGEFQNYPAGLVDLEGEARLLVLLHDATKVVQKRKSEEEEKPQKKCHHKPHGAARAASLLKVEVLVEDFDRNLVPAERGAQRQFRLRNAKKAARG